MSQGSISSYTFNNVSANHTISVTFKVDPNPDGLIYYHFNESSGITATDSSGNGRNATLYGGYTWGAGKFSNAITLNGTSGYIGIPDLGSLGSCTVTTWVYLNALPADFAEILTTDSWVTGSLHCHILPTGQVSFGVNGWDTSPTSSGSLPTGTWKLVSLVFDGVAKTAKIYIDAVPDGSVNLTSATAANLTAVKFGTWQGTQRFLNGKFDEYHIYDRALSSTEIQSLFNYTGVTYTITASAGTGGTITPNGAVVVNQGASQTFNIAPNSGYAISQVTVDTVNQGAITSYTFTNVQANHTISATFVSNNFTITASAGTGGTINPSGAVQVAQGANQTFTIAPNTGYIISSVTVDSVNVGCLRSYTFTNVQANHTIAAAFTANTDLVAYYKFDETSGTTAADCTANAKNGTLYGNCIGPPARPTTP